MQLALLQADVLQTGTEQFWLWIGAGGFTLATIWFVYLAITGHPEKYHHYLSSTFIVLWAGLWYIVMATGGGISTVAGPDGPVVFYYARYIDWTLTTPLLLLGLAWVALGGTSLGRRAGVIAGIVVADVLMILTGVVAGGASGFVSGLFFVISTIFFIVVLALLWGPLRAEAMEGETEGRPGLFFTLASMLTVLWILYPIVWLIGTEGSGLVSSGVEVFFFAVLDVLAKIAFGAILLGGIRSASNSGGQQAASRVS